MLVSSNPLLCEGLFYSNHPESANYTNDEIDDICARLWVIVTVINFVVEKIKADESWCDKNEEIVRACYMIYKYQWQDIIKQYEHKDWYRVDMSTRSSECQTLYKFYINNQKEINKTVQRSEAVPKSFSKSVPNMAKLSKHVNDASRSLIKNSMKLSKFK